MLKITDFKAFRLLLSRDLLLGIRNQSDFINPLIFFIIVITMFPLSVGPEPESLAVLAPAVVWVAALLASGLSVEGIFRSDFEDGTLELMLISRHPGIFMVAAKIIAHWLLSGLPLLVMVMVCGEFLYLPASGLKTLLVTLLLGTPVLSLVGAIAGALTMGLRNSGMLQALLILPLLMPLLIFSVSAVSNAVKGLSPAGEFYFLGAILVLSLTLAPLAVISALRIRLG